MCDKTCIFCFFPVINKYLCMAKRSLVSRCPSYSERVHTSSTSQRKPQIIPSLVKGNQGMLCRTEKSLFFFSKIHSKHIMHCAVRTYNFLMLIPAICKHRALRNSARDGNDLFREGYRKGATPMSFFSNGTRIESEAPKLVCT